MTDESIHLLTGAYVTDALDDTERREFEAHLEGCADCRAEVDSLREALATLTDLTASEPPEELRSRVLADIHTVRPLPPRSDRAGTEETGTQGSGGPSGEGDGEDDQGRGGAHTAPTGRRLRNRLLLAAAAVLAVVGAGVGTAVTVLDDDSTPEAPTVAQQVLAAEDAIHVSRDLQGPGTAEVVLAPESGRAVFVPHQVPAAPEGKVYQLWLQNQSGQMVPAGLMTKPSGPVLIEGSGTIDARAVGITIEPAGGSQHPTTKPLALFSLPES